MSVRIVTENDLVELVTKDELENAISNVEGANDVVHICLPSSDVAVVGREYNIYKDAIIFGNRPYYEYDIAMYLNDSSVQTYTYHDVFRFVPANVGTYTLTVFIRDYHGVTLATKTMEIEVVANAETAGKNVLFIGDSLTAAGIYTAEIQHNLSVGGITSVGTIETTRTVDGVSRTSKHEGRNGWATWDYAGTKSDSLSKFNSSSNVFRNPNTNKFDLAHYMTTYHDGVTLHAVCINLGTNGIGADVSVMSGLNEMVARIKDYDSNLPILIHLTIPEARQDYRADKSGGKNTTHDHMRRCWRSQVTAYMNAYDGKVANVHVVPVYCNMDIVYDFPTVEVAVSARNPEKIYRASDGHPNTYGYLKMADVYYAHLLKYMREGGEVVEPDEPDEPDEPTVVNLVDPSTANDSSPDTTTFYKDEWVNGYYISTSGLSANEGCITTDLFPLAHGQKVKIEGILCDTAEHRTRNRWKLFDSTGKAVYSSYINFMQGEVANGSAGVTSYDATTNTVIIDTSGLTATFNTIAFARFSCYPSGTNEELIVTVVE